MEIKKCSNCGEEKEANKDNFYWRNDGNKWRDECKKCISNKQKEYKIINKDKVKVWGQNYYKRHKEKIKEKHKKYHKKTKDKQSIRKRIYYSKNKDKFRKYKKMYREKYKNNVLYRLRANVSRSVRYALTSQSRSKRSKRGSSILKYLPYTINELKAHLEFLFLPWMNWENYGVAKYGKQRWHIDHIIPQSKLPYDSMEHYNFKKCWALENLRPLDAIENIKKGNSIIQKV